MARLKLVPSDAAVKQSLATDPFSDAALSASAGTGKTHVLTSRVFRLLLNGAAPESILCLTFTKAGAAAMAERIGTRLARWVRLSTPELVAELEALGEDIDPATRERARQLFARVLDAPGGIRIQTIHAFAQSLLAAFPAEAGITPGFQPIEGRAADELVHRTLAELMADAEASGNEALNGDVQALSRRLGERGAVDYLRTCAGREEQMRKLNPATIERDLRGQMGAPDCDIDQFLADHCGDDKFDCDLLRAIADANRSWAATSGLGHVAAIEEWLALSPPQRARSIDLIRAVVLTGKDEPRKIQGQSKHDPDYQEKANRLATAIMQLISIQNACALAADMAAGLHAGQAFAAAYARAKRAAGVADFNDLIGWARCLLEQQGMGEWVRFKLDRRIDHLLVDEAQDTNADQWAIIRALVEDFYSGTSEGDARWRTLLMVGDFKQAIYGFQGTDPREFEQVRAEFKAKADALRAAEDEADDGVRLARDFHDLSMATSFRSAQGVLDAVDSMIAVVGWEAMGLPRAPEPHRAAAKNAGLGASVELWAPFAAAPGDNEAGDDDEEGWIDLRERRYAERLADQVSAWITSDETLGSTGRPVEPGDVLILVRRRGELASLIVARLFEAGVPVAGIDRLHLHEPLAVQDLLAAMSFAVQPLDDLNLACLLVSPLIGWTQEQLLDLAWDRKGRLWPALRDRAGSDASAAEAREVLLQLLNMADYTTPARFLETILTGPIGGRRKLAQRLTMAARDPIDELMSSALQFERDDIPSLERFLAWFRRGDVEIARDPSAPANEVRVMTVHGAKGLEAPVVILADAHADPARLGRAGPIIANIGDARVPVVRPRKEELVEPFAATIADNQRASLEEHWRLLYVGLTRAIDRLVVAGIEPKSGKLPLNSWHGAIGEALDRLGAVEDEIPLWGSARRYSSSGQPAKKSATSETSTKSPTTPLDIPAWANSPAPKEERPPRPLAPSAISTDNVAAAPPSAAQRAAAQRGTWIHALLERLVEVAPEQRRAAAERWLERSAGVDEPAARADIAAQVCAILADSDFAPLFGPGSLGEAPLAATLADGRVIAGTVDRLLVEDHRVSVIDFKTGQVPATDADIPAAHRAQMAAYVAALTLIFPGRALRSALLYTAGPTLFELGA